MATQAGKSKKQVHTMANMTSDWQGQKYKSREEGMWDFTRQYLHPQNASLARYTLGPSTSAGV